MRMSQNYFTPNPEKDDIFALGITILSCLTLENPRLYTINNPFSHNFAEIQSTLLRLSSKYSKDLIDLIQAMLIEKEEARISLVELNIAITKLKGNADKIFIFANSLIQEPMESIKKSQPQSFNPFLSVQKSPEHKFNIDSPRFETTSTYKTPEKPSLYEKIHRVTPGSLGKSSIKIIYTPSKKTEERNKVLDEEYNKNLELIESQKKNTERSMGILKDTIDFLKGRNGSPISESKVIDVNKI
jgi:hypothetical protein